MRTTVTLDPDVEAKLKATMRERGVSFKAALNDAVRVGLTLDNWPNASRDKLLLSFYVSTQGRESKGLARLALAQYLERKAMMAAGARDVKERPTITHDDIVRRPPGRQRQR